jgi:DNA-binding phage protein
MTRKSFDDFVHEVEEEAKSEGPEAVAQLEAYRQHYRLLADVAERRRALGLSQGQVAEAAGVYQTDISKLESGRGNPSLRTVERVLGAIGLELRAIPASRIVARCSTRRSSEPKGHPRRRSPRGAR